MKKYLMSGVAAIAFLAAFTSCSKSTDLYDEGAVQQREEQKKQETIANNIDQAKVQYAAAFEKAFGKVGANVDWGFSSKAATRAAQPNSNQWGTHDDNDKYLDWPKPADITDAERAAVLAVFNQKGKESYTDLLNLTDFFVQQVYCGPNGEKMNQLACWDPQGHEVTENPEWNGYQPHTYTTNDDEVNNFNGGKYSGNALQGCMLMWNSSTSQWSFKTSQSGGQRIYDHWRMEYIPGYGYYVGLDHEAWRQAPANANEEDKRDYIYNDWIIKIVPGKGQNAKQETTTTETRQFKEIVDLGRVFVEDIATAYMKVTDDIDYNDIVFDARVWRIWNQIDTKVNGKITKTIKETNVKYQYDINLLATGGTIEEKVNGVDVHNKFGVGQAFMVNTWTSFCNQSLSGQWNTPTNLIMPKDFSYTLTYDELPIDPKDDSKRLAGINTIPIELRYNTKEMINLSSKVIGENGKTASAPYKLCLPVGTQWPIERRRIDHAYPKFVDYVSNPNTDFTQDLNVDSLYPAPTSTIQAEMAPIGTSEQAKGYIKGWTNYPDNGKIINTDEFKYTVVWAGEVTKDQTPIILYNYDFKEGQTIRFYGEGSISVVCGPGNTNELFSNKNMSENGYVEVQIKDNYIASLLSQGILVQKASKDSNFKLTKIVVF